MGNLREVKRDEYLPRYLLPSSLTEVGDQLKSSLIKVLLNHRYSTLREYQMEDRVETKSLQPNLDPALDPTDREMNLSFTTITTKTKGVALVMSNDYVASYLGSGDKELSEIKIYEESKKLSECLTRFDYFVHHRRNIAKQEFIKLCHRLAEYKYPSNCKRLIIAFSGRGFDGVLQLRDGERIFLEDVVGYFKSNNVALPGSMIRMFLIDTHHGNSLGSLVQGDSVIVKAGDDCRCLKRIKMDANILVAYSSIRYHDKDVENFNLHGKWTGCLADELERSQFTSMQKVLAMVNKTMADTATEAKYFQIADFRSSAEELFVFPSLNSSVNPTVAISLPITQ